MNLDHNVSCSLFAGTGQEGSDKEEVAFNINNFLSRGKAYKRGIYIFLPEEANIRLLTFKKYFQTTFEYSIYGQNDYECSDGTKLCVPG